MDTIHIDKKTLEPIGEALLDLITIHEELQNAIYFVKYKIMYEFEGNASESIELALDETMKRVNATIADTIQKNYDDFETLQGAFEELDATASNYILNNNYRTSDFSATVERQYAGNTGNNYTDVITNTTGTQYTRK
ncbi:MAG: hypothetical protein ACK5LC_06485 [Coprobacillaceae bacterium]